LDLATTRLIINSILDDSIKKYEFATLPVFSLKIPEKIDGIDTNILDPPVAWTSQAKWHIAATDLAFKFINNFSKFALNEETARLAEHGPLI
jgi:phosphoenolpyruvate carboxykinase (ATP)